MALRIGSTPIALRARAVVGPVTPKAKANLAASLITAHFKKNSARFPNTDDYDTNAVKRIIWGIGEKGIQVKKANDGKFDVVVPFYDSNRNTREADVSIALKDVLKGKHGLPAPSNELKAALKDVRLTVLRVGN